MTRILFLDIDGVVLHGEALWANNSRCLPPEKIELVAEVCRRAGAVVVVSSTWRKSDETEHRLRGLGLPVHRDWRTDFTWQGENGECVDEVRGHQIERWLTAHPDTESYAIVDDDSDMLPHQMPRFIKTPFDTGIDREHVEALVGILNTPLWKGRMMVEVTQEVREAAASAQWEDK